MKVLFLSILVTLTAIPVLAASGGYVTTADVRIYERPDENAHIVFDLPRLRKVFFEPLDRNWARVVSVGTREVGWCPEQGSGRFNQGKYGKPIFHLCEGDELYPQTGFIQLSRLGSFPPDALPLPQGGYQAVEQFWQEWGIVDDRQLVVDLERHPFNAIVRVLSQGKERPPTFGPFQWTGNLSGLSGCSGAFVYAKSLVLTAKHCIKDRIAPLTVRIERGRDRYEDIQAWVIDQGEYDGEGKKFGDWAVLRLDREPRLSVEPLEFAERMDWSMTAAYQGLVVGYPADMFAQSKNALGFFAPTVTVCRPGTVSRTIEQMEIMVHMPCGTFKGNSGGPLLIWESTAHKFRIVGVSSHLGSRLGFGGLNAYEDSDQQRERLLSKVNSILPRQFSEKDMSRWDTDSIMFLIPGISKLFERDNSYSTTTFSFGKNTLALARAAAGLPILDSQYWNDRRYLGFFFLQSAERVGVPGSLRGTNFIDGYSDGGFIINDVMEVRKLCAVNCQGEQLDSGRQQAWSYGDKMDPMAIKELIRSRQALPVSFSAEYPQFYNRENRHRETEFESTKFLATLAWTDKPRVLHLVTGGDLFIIDREDFSIIGVQRGVMNLRREGLPFNEHFSQRHAPREPATGARRELNGQDGIGKDFGVEVTAVLKSENFGQPTPVRVPGGQLIGTRELRDKLRSEKPPVIVAAMNDRFTLPGAVTLGYASNGGTFTDATQAKLANALNELTHGDKNQEVVFYCHHPRCWLSYNAMLRASQMGYAKLRWFRGGIEAWIEAGLALDEQH